MASVSCRSCELRNRPSITQMPDNQHAPDPPPQYNALNNIILRCSFVDVDNIGGYSWQFVLPLDCCRTWRSLCDKLSTCLSLIRDLEAVPYPGETTFWARDMNADGFICKEDWEQLVYGGGKYELIFRSNLRIKQSPLAGNRENLLPGLNAGVPTARPGSSGLLVASQATVLPRFAGGRKTMYEE